MALPESEFHRLIVWALPRPRTRREALADLGRGPEAFSPSAKLRRLIDHLQSRRNVHVDWANTDAPDRLVILAVGRSRFSDEVAELTAVCRDLGLTLFDSEGERLLVPSSRANNMPRPKTPGIPDSVRNALGEVELSDDAAEDARRLTAKVLEATQGVLAESLLPSLVRLPFQIPTSLRFAIPAQLPVDRQKKAVARRLIADLHDDNPNARRYAAFDLGGWDAAPDIDRELIGQLSEESDPYVRAVIAMSLSVRNSSPDVDLIRVARTTVDEVRSGERNSLRHIAASIAVLAATIVVTRSPSPRCAEVRAMSESVATLPGEEARARALSTVLSEYCGNY